MPDMVSTNPLDQMPAGVPPPGVNAPNFVDPPTIAPALITVNAVLMPITALFVVGRLWSNFHSSRKLGWDDGMPSLCPSNVDSV